MYADNHSNSFVTLSTILEGVGTSAYLGGAPLLQDKDILTTAGAILVTEALHTSQQRLSIGEVPAPIDLGTPLDANSVFTLASSFIVECPADNTPLPFTANPGLAVDLAAAGCPMPAGDALFKRTSHEMPAQPAMPAEHVAAPPPAHVMPAEVAPPMPEHVAAPPPAHVMPAEVAPPMPEHVAAPPPPPAEHVAPPPAEHVAPPPPPPAEHVAPPPAEHVVENVECGKVTAAQPCPFLMEGAQVPVNADAEIPAGSFMTFVSALSVVSVEAQITGQQAVAAVPAGVSGQVYAFITSRSIDDNKLAADAIAFGPAIVESEFLTPLYILKPLLT